VLAARGPGHWAGAVTFRALRLAGIVWVCLLLCAGCHQLNSTVLGKAPQGEPQTISSVKNGNASSVTIQGVMIEKCPVAGCWFYLRDSTGVIKVDTKLAGFVVLDVPLQSRLTVTGSKVMAGSNEITIAASGIRY